MTIVDPIAGNEWQTLTGFLDHYRGVLDRKTTDFDDAQLRARITPSTMTLGGLLKHLTVVEDFWFGRVWAGRPSALPVTKDEWRADPNWDWNSATTDSAAALRQGWAEAVQRSREVVCADPTLDGSTLGPRKSAGKYSRRWVLVHMIGEYARHCGHADYLAEALDGRTGD